MYSASSGAAGAEEEAGAGPRCWVLVRVGSREGAVEQVMLSELPGLLSGGSARLLPLWGGAGTASSD